MKKISLLLLTAVLLFIACGGKEQPKQTSSESDPAMLEETQDGVLRMKDYNYQDTIRTGNRVYTYSIHREYSDSLPMVQGDDGYRFADNVYTLTINSGGTPIFSRSFTKKAFMSYLSEDFRRNGLLDGMMYDESLPGLCFAVSVTLPQSDMVEALLMRVSTDGGISISRDDRGEAELAGEVEEER